MTVIHFNTALRLAEASLIDSVLTKSCDVRLVRDFMGRVRFAVNANESDVPESLRNYLKDSQGRLGAYAADDDPLYRESFTFPDDFFSVEGWRLVARSKDDVASQDEDFDESQLDEAADSEGREDPDVSSSTEDGKTSLDRSNESEREAEEPAQSTYLLLDRQITGHEWLHLKREEVEHPHRLVFFGLKGGVGRSTALCMTAWGLAQAGKRVLLVDFDLESPGLTGLLLPEERTAEFGVVDWLVEDAVGQGGSVLNGLVSASPIGDSTLGAVRVVSAMGAGETDYLSKLSRVYADVPGEAGPQHLGDRLRRLIETLEEIERPDVVLIDSRAGLHDLAAVSITSLADTALLFATDGFQTWNGYAQLFAHWQHRPEVARNVRERLAIVRALMPKSGRESSGKSFASKSYSLFAATLYDELPRAKKKPVARDLDVDLFHPAIDDEAAPHHPIIIDWDERFQEFDPTLRPENGGATDAQIKASFGRLIEWVSARVSEVNL